jgi:hypothetical protein
VPCIQLQALHTRWQQYADQQEHVFIAQRVKLNVTAKGEDYSLMWAKLNFAVHANPQTSDYIQMLQQ